MCSIGSSVARYNVVPVLIEGFTKLECGGYDPDCVAVIGQGSIERVRSIGRVAELETESASAAAVTGIAHTRWATDGAPSGRNSLPRVSGSIAIVHNGIMKNYESLRSEFTAQGNVFISDNDTVLGTSRDSVATVLLPRSAGQAGWVWSTAQSC